MRELLGTVKLLAVGCKICSWRVNVSLYTSTLQSSVSESEVGLIEFEY